MHSTGLGRSVQSRSVPPAVAAWKRRNSGQGSPPSEYRSLLESNGKTVDLGKDASGASISRKLYACACKCKSRFCEECCEKAGWALRKDLQKALWSFKDLMMWTFTIDPTLFASPEDAYEYCRRKRVISEFVRSMHKRGFLHSKRYFCAVEWQNGTEQVHFHLLLDASFIPWQVALERWGRFRPPGITKSDETRPDFGTVHFTGGLSRKGKMRFKSKDHAANYATKYCIKYPEEGFPEWVMQRLGHTDRYHVSQSFWVETGVRGPAPKKEPKKVERCAPDCFCEKCIEGEGRAKTCIQDRIDRCAQGQAVIMEETTVRDTEGNETKSYRFRGSCLYSWKRCLEILGLGEEGPTRWEVSGDAARQLLGDYNGDFAYTVEEERQLAVEYEQLLFGFG